MQADAILARARALVGVPFRLHGRDAGVGVDCVGLIALAFDQLDNAPRDYALRNSLLPQWEAQLALHARRCVAPPHKSDVLVMRVAPAQLHLGIWSGASLIHADARIGRVVETPGAPPWPIQSVWRFWI
jgi:murein DD-endopeptidase / murein LD-carboxypeptidase